jgi:hypothetical protein
MSTHRPSLLIPLAGLLVAWGCAQGARPGGGFDGGPIGRPDGGGGGTDGGPGADGDDKCETNEECDDGLACNGVEICDPLGDCVIGTPGPVCDDAIDCTRDECVEPGAACTNTADDGLCPDMGMCRAAEGGCVVPPPCTSDGECDDSVFCNGAETCDTTAGCRSGTPPSCDDGMSCTTDICDATADACTSTGVDADGDGFVAMGCAGGTDCNDSASAVRPGATEICDGIDNDCSGSPDDGGGLACALGSAPSACSTSCATSGMRSCNAVCAWGPCAAAMDTCGNACDDDADGSVDEGCGSPAPPNDQCTGATLLTGSGTRTIDTLVGATAQTTDCGNGTEIFFRVSPTVRSIVYLDTLGTGFDTRISYRGTSCPGSAAACIDDSCGSLQTQIARVLAPGTHYFAVHTFSSATVPGPVTLRYQTLPAASGDNLEITGPGTWSGSTSGSSAIAGTCAGGGPEDAFYFMQCTGVSRSVTADTCSSSTWYDTTLHIWNAAGQLSCSDDDISCFWDTYHSYTTASASGPGVYAIYVDGWSSGSAGSYTVIISW